MSLYESSIITLFTSTLTLRKRQVPFRAQEMGLTSTDDEQLGSITRRHIVNELRRTTGNSSKNNEVNTTGTLVVVSL